MAAAPPTEPAGAGFPAPVPVPILVGIALLGAGGLLLLPPEHLAPGLPRLAGLSALAVALLGLPHAPGETEVGSVPPADRLRPRAVVLALLLPLGAAAAALDRAAGAPAVDLGRLAALALGLGALVAAAAALAPRCGPRGGLHAGLQLGALLGLPCAAGALERGLGPAALPGWMVAASPSAWLWAQGGPGATAGPAGPLLAAGGLLALALALREASGPPPADGSRR